MQRILELLCSLTQMLRSRYVRELEREVARLRTENRALLNSLLGTAGVPPLRVEEHSAAAPFTYPQSANAARARVAGSTERQTVATPPLRRRSWQQIGRMLEIEEARRERDHAAQLAHIREKLASDSTTHQKGSNKPNGSG